MSDPIYSREQDFIENKDKFDLNKPFIETMKQIQRYYRVSTIIAGKLVNTLYLDGILTNKAIPSDYMKFISY